MRSWTKDHFNTPIPMIGGIAGREQMQVRECNESMVALSNLLPARIRVYPAYYLEGYELAGLECFVRKSVALKLLHAADRLPADHSFVVLDAWRPIALQREIYEKQKAILRAKTPTTSEADLDSETRKYVSYPSADPAVPPPHLTGGAIDITISNATNVLLDMGTAFDHFGPEAATRHFEEKIEQGHSLSTEDEGVLGNRRLLYHLLADVGFSNYCEEWWHYDYGNQFWAKLTNQDSIYGPTHRHIDAF
jgi:D-alanyl-D-alanine dipeptidase